MSKSSPAKREFNRSVCFYGVGGHVALDRNPVLGDNSLLLQLIPFRQSGCQTPALTHMCQGGGSLYQFYDGLWYDPAGA